MDRFMRIAEIRDKTGYSRGHIARLEASGNFPRRRRIGARTAAWLESEVDEWMRSRPLAADVRPDAGGDLPHRGHGGPEAVDRAQTARTSGSEGVISQR